MKKLIEARDAVAALTTEIVELSELDDITPEQDERLDAAIAELPEREEYVAKLEARAAIIERAAAQPDQDATRGGWVPGSAPMQSNKRDPFDLSDLRFGAPESEVRGRAITAVETIKNVDDSQRGHVTELLERHGGELIGRVLGTGTDAYRTGAAKLMAGQGHMLVDSERNAIERAQSLTDASGGFAVPFTLDPTIMLTNAGTDSPLRQISRTTTIVTDSWNGVSSAGATATYKAESAEMTDNAVTLAQPSVPVHRLDVYVPFSFEIGQDWAGFESDMRMVMADAKARAENTAFTTGTGTNQPTGFVTALDGTASEIAPTTAETFAVADIYKLEEALGDRFIGNASWVANRGIYNDIRQFDTSGGANLWERLGAATPPELIGYPAYKASDMDSGFNAAATADNFILAFGDFRAGFLIVDRVGMNFEVQQHVLATANNRPNGQRALLAWCRNGSDVVVDEAIKLLSIPTTA